MITVAFKQAGTHDIFAYYDGDTNVLDAATHVGQRVNPVNATLALTSSGTSGGITLTAQLSAPPSGAPAATGSIEFFDGRTSLGKIALSNGSASLSPVLGAGAHQISATYSGDPNWYQIRSQALSITINRIATTITLTGVFDPAQTILKAQIAGSQNAVITGNVQFTDTTTNQALGSSDVSGGTAEFTLSSTGALAVAGHPIIATYSGDGALAPSTSDPLTLVAIVNAAGQVSTSLAPGEIVSLFGAGLGDSTQQATATPLPETLGELTVTITDSAGASHNAGLSYVSPAQVNFVLPEGLASGSFTLTVSRAGASIYALQGTIAAIAPGIFTVSGDGHGTAAAQILRIKPDGTRSMENTASPIAMDGDALYLILYGTGIRSRSGLDKVTCVINGQNLPVVYAGAQSEFAGLDQVDVLLPVSLQGTGTVTVTLIVDGQSSNAVTLTFQ